MTLNRDLLERVKTRIELAPDHHDQESFWSPSVGLDYDTPDVDACFDLLLAEKCGTTACIAGWAIALAESEQRRAADFRIYNPMNTAARLLGITYDQAEYLFYGLTTNQAVPKVLQHLLDNPDASPEELRKIEELLQ